MDKFQKFIKHNQGRTMYLFVMFPSGTNKFLRIDKEDKLEFSNEEIPFLINHTKKWGTYINFIVDVVVSMTGVTVLDSVGVDIINY